MSEHRIWILRRGLIGTCAFVALVLLAAFYSTVSGAVDRAARHRLIAADSAPQGASVAVRRPAARNPALLARVDN